MNKSIILLIIAIVFIAIVGYFIFSGESVEVYVDGENVSTHSVVSPLKGVDTNELNVEICEYTLETMDTSEGDYNTLKNGIREICAAHGLNNVNVKIDSTLGENKIPILFHVEGTSMDPTLRDGQVVLIEKTKDIHVNNIVVADSDEYGRIIKRVAEIDDGYVHLVSDNKSVTHEIINGTPYETKGINTWVDIRDIYGVAVEY